MTDGRRYYPPLPPMSEVLREPATHLPVHDLTGMMVGRFAVRSCLGAGGMGEVYRADDTALKRPVALKRLAPQLRTDTHYRQRFLKEAERASALSHEYIASIYDVLEEKGEPFLVMEYVEGATLRARLPGPLPLDQFWIIALQTAEAMEAAHEKHIVHRDLKPENIMLTPSGRVKILDFGVAKQLPRTDEDAETDTGETLSGGLNGTPAYMAPEVLVNHAVDGRADIFSLGVVFYETLTGRNPFRAANLFTVTDRILHEVPPPASKVNPLVPMEVGRIVEKMLAKSPEDRYPDASALLADLRRARTEKFVPVFPLRPIAAQGKKLWKLIITAAALLAIILAAVLVIHLLWPGPVIPQRKNLVVLPFQAIGGNPQNQMFCDGLTATLTAQLTRLTVTHTLQVAPASEVWARKVTTVDAAQHDLGGNLVLAGTLYWSGETLRVNISLEDANTRRQLRAATITSDASNPFAFQDQVAERVVRMLELELQPSEHGALASHGTTHPAAYDFYLQGLGYLQDYQKAENIDSAIALFNHALKADPHYALAMAGLGQADWKKYESSKDSKWIESARLACEQALSLDANLAAGYACLGNISTGTGQYDKAKFEFLQALDNEPTSDEAYRGLARADERSGKTNEAEQTYLRAIDLRPGYWAGYSWLGDFYRRMGQFEKSAQMFERVVELAPDNHRGYSNLGAVYFQLERWSDAEKMYKKSLALRESGAAYSNLGTLYFFQGRYGEAARMFEHAAAASPKEEYVLGNLADSYRWTPGEADKAPGAYSKAIGLAEEQLRLDPRSSETLAHLALYRAKSGEKAGAVRTIEQAMAITPGNANLMYIAAVVYHLAGYQKRSLALLKDAVSAGYPLNEIRADPELQDLRNDSMFKSIVRTS
jgi:tetratricopeptide (TPR) repeat protein/TolB-like protein/predicted Ser/Thr protein kinase